MKKLLITLMMVITTNAFAVSIVGPREGNAVAVAKDIIFNIAEQPCGQVVSAKRVEKGMIVARCSNNEKYLIAVFKDAPMTDGSRKDVPIALRCSIAKEKFNLDCPQ